MLKKLLGLCFGFALMLLLNSFTFTSTADAAVRMSPVSQEFIKTQVSVEWTATWDAAGSNNYSYKFHYGNGNSQPHFTNVKSSRSVNLKWQYAIPNGMIIYDWKPSVHVIDTKDPSFSLGVGSAYLKLKKY